MPEKQFKIIRTIKVKTIASALTNRLQTLTALMERLQRQHPNDDFAIVDNLGNPVELADYLKAELAHPVAKAKEREAAKKQAIKEKVKAQLRRL